MAFEAGECAPKPLCRAWSAEVPFVRTEMVGAEAGGGSVATVIAVVAAVVDVEGVATGSDVGRARAGLRFLGKPSVDVVPSLPCACVAGAPCGGRREGACACDACASGACSGTPVLDFCRSCCGCSGSSNRRAAGALSASSSARAICCEVGGGGGKGGSWWTAAAAVAATATAVAAAAAIPVVVVVVVVGVAGVAVGTGTVACDCDGDSRGKMSRSRSRPPPLLLPVTTGARDEP